MLLMDFLKAYSCKGMDGRRMWDPLQENSGKVRWTQLPNAHLTKPNFTLHYVHIVQYAIEINNVKWVNPCGLPAAGVRYHGNLIHML